MLNDVPYVSEREQTQNQVGYSSGGRTVGSARYAAKRG